MAFVKAIDPRNILAFSAAYNLFSRFMGGKARRTLINDYVKAKAGDKILDIGCGPGNVLAFLPTSVDYTGADIDPTYIETARQKYGDRGTFICQIVDKTLFPDAEVFDIVLASGLVHHLSDTEAHALFETAKHILKKGGRLITLDGCFTKDQSPIAKLILSQDRGEHVRHREAYEAIAHASFRNVKTSVHHNLSRLPYTHLIMECVKSGDATTSS